MAAHYPTYNITVPSETTRFRDLGKDLREMGASIDAALKSFDYHGADPNLVLSRVAVLEARNISHVPGVLVGTSTQRGNTVAPYGTIWQDSDYGKRRWISNGTGWRFESGTATAPAGAFTSWANGNAGRTVSVTIPTAIDTGETIQVTPTSVGTGFGIVSLSTVTRNPDSTVLSLRHMQLNSDAQNAFSFIWRVVPV